MYKAVYYMASSVSREDKLNPVLWLASQAGNMELPCPLRTTHSVPHEKCPGKPYNKSFTDQVWGQDGWILASFFFCEFIDLDSFLVHEHAKKELDQYSAILTSHLVNNPCKIKRRRYTGTQDVWTPIWLKNLHGWLLEQYSNHNTPCSKMATILVFFCFLAN